MLGRLSGRTHGGLCDITHGLRLRERGEWHEQRARLPVSFEIVHLDERSPEVADACSAAPCVVAHTDKGVVPLLAPEDINMCSESGDVVIAAIERAADARVLTFGSPAAR